MNQLLRPPVGIEDIPAIGRRAKRVFLPLEYVHREEFVPQATDEKTISAKFDSHVTKDGLDHVHHVAQEQTLHEVESLHSVPPAVVVTAPLLSVQFDGVEAVDAVNVEVGGPRHEAVVASPERDLGPVGAIMAARPRPRCRTDVLAVKVSVGRDPAARVRHNPDSQDSDGSVLCVF